jgi:asparagine synthase (glutamine-hydrolysing)
MCGIAGFMGGLFNVETDIILRQMTDALAHRGPDSFGIWTEKNQSIAFAHRRLSILDLSPAGLQPMISKSGRYVIIFNGEIYNHLELREDLNARKNHTWFGYSDTETLLACIEYWGLEVSIKKTLGMFSIALWDKEKQVLNLVRDRIGEKPLYYGWQGSGKSRTFLFGSELNIFSNLNTHRKFWKLLKNLKI